MNVTTNVEHGDFMQQGREATMSIVAGGSFAEAIGGVGAVVLAILALVGVMPERMAAIATLAVGGALLLEGIAIATRFSNLSLRRGEALRTLLSWVVVWERSFWVEWQGEFWDCWPFLT